MSRPYTPASLAEEWDKDRLATEAIVKSARRARTRQDAGFIYFIRCRDMVKIGFSVNTTNRLNRIQSFCPYPLTLIASIRGTMADEAALHDRFSSYREHSEWFRCEGDLAEYVATLGRKP